jgi:very-short-patch-repair endonuclease
MSIKARATPTARLLRKDSTEAEKRFWEIVRNRRFHNKKFLRQHAICFPYMGKMRYFVADIYCAEVRLVVEIDGSIHENQQEYDAYRTELINQRAISVVRLKNEDSGFLKKIEAKLFPYFSSAPPLFPKEREGAGG